MIVFKKVKPLQKHLDYLRSNALSIGFAPTMGALHQGHISLMNASQKQCDITVCSIFVNPTQFNEVSDLSKYPRTTKEDLNMLLRADVDIVFLPTVEEIYPEGEDYEMPYDLGPMASVLEGEQRPGHFEGVVQVVDRLLQIVKPNALFMGQKDFQQFSIIQRMLDLQGSDTRLAVCPIIREQDGLAMSSRNVRLSKEERQKALVLKQALDQIHSNFRSQSISVITEEASKLFNQPDIRLEYLSVVDGYTLQELKEIDEDSYAVAVVAAWVGEVRLIDNMILQDR